MSSTSDKPTGEPQLDPAGSAGPANAAGWSEDWLAILLGGGLLVLFALVCLGATAGAEEVRNPLAGYLGKPGSWTSSPVESFLGKKTPPPILGTVGAGLLLGGAFALGIRLMGESAGRFLAAFPVVFVLATLSYVLTGQVVVKAYNIEYALWALAIGLLVANTIGVPGWLLPAVRTEFYIKTGLVLYGAEILFGKLLALGVPGIGVAWVVTPIVLIATFWFGQRVLRLASPTLNMVISADMSVCGVSAAIATAAACRAKKEELTLAISLSLAFTVVMMIVLPLIIPLLGLNAVEGGAWLGGTIDSTGAVAVAGARLGPAGEAAAVTIKMIQNVLIGVIAFAVAVYWCAKVDCVEGQKVTLWEIWHRFPKFVIGFIVASVLFSAMYSSMGADVGYTMLDHGVLRGFTRGMRGWFFCLAFVSIGLATNFRELAHYFKGGKPVILYVFGQSFNLCLTLLMAYIMFFLVFPDITARI